MCLFLENKPAELRLTIPTEDSTSQTLVTFTPIFDMQAIEWDMKAFEDVHCVALEINLLLCKNKAAMTEERFLKGPSSRRPMG
jgi:hypothetical protein